MEDVAAESARVRQVQMAQPLGPIAGKWDRFTESRWGVPLAGLAAVSFGALAYVGILMDSDGNEMALAADAAHQSSEPVAEGSRLNADKNTFSDGVGVSAESALREGITPSTAMLGDVQLEPIITFGPDEAEAQSSRTEGTNAPFVPNLGNTTPATPGEVTVPAEGAQDDSRTRDTLFSGTVQDPVGATTEVTVREEELPTATEPEPEIEITLPPTTEAPVATVPPAEVSTTPTTIPPTPTTLPPTTEAESYSCSVTGEVNGSFISARAVNISKSLAGLAFKWDVWKAGGARYDTNEGVTGFEYVNWGGSHIDTPTDIYFTVGFDTDGDGDIDTRDYNCSPYVASGFVGTAQG